MLEKISGLVPIARAELKTSKRTHATKLLKALMLKAEKALADNDQEALEKVVANQHRLEQMNVKDVMDFVEEK